MVWMYLLETWPPNSYFNDIWRWGLWEVIRIRWGPEGGALTMALAAVGEEEVRPNCTGLLSPGGSTQALTRHHHCVPGLLRLQQLDLNKLVINYPISSIQLWQQKTDKRHLPTSHETQRRLCLRNHWLSQSTNYLIKVIQLNLYKDS